jgi:hypothetical protein
MLRRFLSIALLIGWQVNDEYEGTGNNIYILCGIRTHRLGVQAIKAYTSYRPATDNVFP